MRFLTKILAGVAVAAMMTGTAMAADANPAALPSPVPTVPPPTTSFAWAGPYVGAYGGYNTHIPPGAAGILAGYNFNTGKFVIGIEAQFGVFFPSGGGPPGPDAEASINLRTGYLITDRLLAYGVAGVGTVFCCGFPYWSAGGGAEFAIGSKISVFAEARAFNGFGVAPPVGLMLRGGINLHIGH